MTTLPLSPFIDTSKPFTAPERDFQPDLDALWHAIDPASPDWDEPSPIFISKPSPEYLTAVEIEPLLRTIARR